MSEIMIAAAAESEYAASFQWYAGRSQQAAENFETEFAKALKEISAHPERYPRCDDQHRFYLFKRFPYQIIYKKTSHDQLLVVAVAHTGRRPGYWI